MRLCSKCGEPHGGHRSYCNACHAAYTRSWRKLHPLAFDREKDNARSYAGAYKRKGKLTPQPCEACADEAVQMHHDDYSKPLEVRWLCAPCHRKFHAVTRETASKSARPKSRPFVFSDMPANSRQRGKGSSVKDRVFAVAGDWALASDGIQWILLRRWKDGKWRGVSFVRSTRDILARCMREKGTDNASADLLLSGLPDTFDQWKSLPDASEKARAAA